MLKLKLEQRGDTIVEVLIAMVIIGIILLGAALAANASTSNVQRSQERSEAVQLLQNQIEALRYVNNAGTPPLPSPGTTFCLYYSGGAYAVSLSEAGATPSTYSNPSTQYNSNCNITPNGNGTNPEFSISLNSSDGGTTYTAQAIWFAIGGKIDSASLAYKLL